jgi:hypothetical protein
MQRLLRFFAVLAVPVVVAGGAYLAYDRAAEHPDSFWGRCAWLAYGAVTEYNPLPAICQAVAKGGQQLCQCMTPAKTSTATARPAHAGSSVVGSDAVVPMLHPMINRMLDEAVNAQQQHHDFLHDPPLPPAGAPDGPEQGLIEESEDCAKTMLPCADEEDDPPATMPYAEPATVEGEKASASCDDHCQDAAGQPGAAEESEAVHPATPPTCQEDPEYHHQYPGCPYSGVCPYTGRCATDAPLPEEKPAPEGKKEAAGAAETPPACPSGRCVPPTKKHPHGHQKGGDEPGQKAGTPADQKSQHDQPVRPKPGSDKSEDCPPHPEVDTTDFRPSDAHEGEFDNRPL